MISWATFATNGTTYLDSIPVSLAGTNQTVRGFVELNNVTTQEFTYEVEVISAFPVIVTNVTDQAYTPSDGMAVYNVSGYFTDPDGGSITYLTPTLTNGSALPSWISFDGEAFTSNTSETNNADILLTASDQQGQTKSQTFSVSVVNSAPIVVSALGVDTKYENISYSYSIDLNTIFSDPDGQTLTFSILSQPVWLSSASISGSVLSLTGTPAYSDIGDHIVRLEASDGSLSVIDNLTISIVENKPPVAPTLSDINVIEGDVITYTVPVFPDPEGDIVSYQIKYGNGSALDPALMTFNPGNRVLTVNTYVGIDSIISLLAVATDNFNPSVYAPFNILINTRPQLNSTFGTLNNYMMAQRPSSFTIPSELFSDEDTTLTYALTETDGSPVPAWLSFVGPPSTSTGEFTFSGTYPFAQDDDLEYILKATDSQGGSTTVSVFILVICKCTSSYNIASCYTTCET